MNEISIKLLVRLKFMQSAQPSPELHYSFEVGRLQICEIKALQMLVLCVLLSVESKILVKTFHDKKCNATGRYKRELKDK